MSNSSLKNWKDGKKQLTSRSVNCREPKRPIQVKEFDLTEIKNHFDEEIERIRSLNSIRCSLDDEEISNQILKGQIVFAESCLDFYLHELDKYGVLAMYRGEWSRTNQLNKLQLSFEDIESVITRAIKGDILNEQWLLDAANKKFFIECYLSYSKMDAHLKLIGINLNEALKEMNSSPEPNSQNKAKETIQELFKVRNQIVHQSNRSHADAEFYQMSTENAEKYIEDIKKIGDLIYEAARKRHL